MVLGCFLSWAKHLRLKYILEKKESLRGKEIPIPRVVFPTVEPTRNICCQTNHLRCVGAHPHFIFGGKRWGKTNKPQMRFGTREGLRIHLTFLHFSETVFLLEGSFPGVVSNCKVRLRWYSFLRV